MDTGQLFMPFTPRTLMVYHLNTMVNHILDDRRPHTKATRILIFHTKNKNLRKKPIRLKKPISLKTKTYTVKNKKHILSKIKTFLTLLKTQSLRLKTKTYTVKNQHVSYT